MRMAIGCLLFPLFLVGQTESWSGVAFEHEVSRQWGYVIDVEHRRSLTSMPEPRFLLLLAGNRLLATNLNLTAGSRLTPAANEDASVLRTFADLNYKLPLERTPFALESRLRYQLERLPGKDGSTQRSAIRPRLGVVTALVDNVSLIAEFEGRYRFDVRNEWSRVRYTAGLEYEVYDQLKLELFWRREDRINQRVPNATTIIGLYMDYTLPDSRDRQWKYRHPFGRRVTW